LRSPFPSTTTGRLHCGGGLLPEARVPDLPDGRTGGRHQQAAVQARGAGHTSGHEAAVLDGQRVRGHHYIRPVRQRTRV